MHQVLPRRRVIVQWIAAAALAGAGVAAHAQSATTTPQYGDSIYTPQVAQPGKDVIWVPTPDVVVARMLTMAQAGPSDFVADLGAGDGKIAIMAARRFGARAMGVEFNPDMAKLAERNAERAGVADRVRIINGDIFQTDFSQATVVTLFLLPHLNIKLRPTLLTMKPGTRVVSHAFTMDDWQPDDRTNIDGRVAYLWIVPANVQGRWRFNLGPPGFEQPIEFDITQIYQRIEGEAHLPGMRAMLREARLSGESIGFSILDAQGVRHDFAGHVSGKEMTGIVRSAKAGVSRWRAIRN